MHVVVVGCGRVGSSLALSLQESGHTVAVIDKQQAAFKRLSETYSGKTVVGIGFDRDRLAEAGIEEAGALAAVTNGDNSNILVARIALETYGIQKVVARIYDPRRAVIYQRLGIPTVAAVAWTTDQVMRRLFPEHSTTEWSDPSGSLSLVERALPDEWAGRRLAGMGEAGRYRVVSLSRSGQGARLPGRDAVGQEGDILHILVRQDSLDHLEERLSHPEDS